MTYLYRAFDATGGLLYVGITVDMRQRFGPGGHEHALWADDIVTITAELYPTRRDAQKAELQAIKTESPRWNVAGSPKAQAVSAEKWRRSQVPRNTPPKLGTPEGELQFERRMARAFHLRGLVRRAELQALIVDAARPEQVPA